MKRRTGRPVGGDPSLHAETVVEASRRPHPLRKYVPGRETGKQPLLAVVEAAKPEPPSPGPSLPLALALAIELAVASRAGLGTDVPRTLDPVSGKARTVRCRVAP
jgi:hypothetical protein